MKLLINKLLVGLLALLLCSAALAQEDSMKDLPGYVDFGELSSLYGDPKVQIAVGEALLSMISAFDDSDDPELSAALNALKGVRVNVYGLNGSIDTARDHLADIVTQLGADNWEPVLNVREDNEVVQVFLKMNGEMVDGLTLMAADGSDDEVVFINLIGQIDPQSLARVAERFDVDVNLGNGPDESK